VLAAVTDAGDNHLTRVYAHPQLQVNVFLFGQFGGVGLDRCLHRQPGQYRALRVVLVGRSRAEEGHQAIAPELVHFAAEAVDLCFQDVEDVVHDVHPRLAADLFQ
jgi:hypothetical protein